MHAAATWSEPKYKLQMFAKVNSSILWIADGLLAESIGVESRLVIATKVDAVFVEALLVVSILVIALPAKHKDTYVLHCTAHSLCGDTMLASQLVLTPCAGLKEISAVK
jgi:hypothetical protein